MIARTVALACGVFAVGFALFCSFARADDGLPKPEGIQFKAGEFVMTGPFAQGNLTIYLIHGPDHVTPRSYLTLREAIQKKTAIVHETRFANELAVENLSKDADLYIQAGEIVKGGLQDRAIGADYLIPPTNGFVPVKAFCIDLGRWEARPGESVDRFDSAPAFVSGRLMTLAVLRSASQDQVWWAVKLTQRKLAASAGHSVADRKWANCYQLAAENPAVQQAVLGYAEPLGTILSRGGEDVIGCAVVINGKLSSADVYASHALFVRLWPKLLNSAAMEAFAERPRDKVVEPAGFEAMKSLIEGVDRVRATTKDVTRRIVLITRESKDAVIFESFDRLDPRASTLRSGIHRVYLTKQGYNPPGPGGAAQDAGAQRIIIPKNK